MFPETNGVMCLVLSLVLIASSEAFFLKWGSDSTSQSAPKTWVQPMGGSVSPYRYQYAYPQTYDTHKLYQMQGQNNMGPEMGNSMGYSMGHSMGHSMGPIPISVPAAASLTPVSLQHVQLVPCMCPVAPEEADKLQDQVGPGPYLAQTYQPAYSAQQLPADNTKNTKQ